MFHSRHHEVKQEGAIEAAQNPKSKVTSEDAERVLVQDTRSAGGAAFQFDPNASPEQKAAQARATIPEELQRPKRTHAGAVVSDTDLDDDTPAYDLPPASTDGVVTTPSQPLGSHEKHLENGLSEDARWHRDRVGWAPRFGNGDPKDDEGPTLLDHQTWLEGQISDKLYGDWYYNAGIIIFACFATHVVTLLGGGLAAMFVILAICSTYYRTSLRRVRRNFRDDITRQMAKARLETDTESLEWINSFLVKFWPIYAPVLCDTIVNAVDQVLSTSTPAFLDSLRMKTFVLGSKPPRLEHVKTYPKTEEDTVLMDWKFSFNPNDTADFTARQLKNKINPKVVLEIRVGKGIVSKGLDVIVEDFAFSGLMRVRIKLQIPFPHIEKAEICFLERPAIDYKCKPIGGDMFGFDINIIPGLEGFIQEQIHANLSPIMYDPNVFPIEIAKLLSGNLVDQAIGVVQVTLHGGQGLRNPDKYPGIPDPYVDFSINGRASVGKSKTVKQNSNPRWNQSFNIIITSLSDSLLMNVFDWNEYRKDKELGTATFPLERFADTDTFEGQQLEVMGGGRARGVLEADIRFFKVLDGEKQPDGTVGPPPETNTGIAKFVVEQAKDLDGTKSLVGALNPYAVLLLNGREVHVSKKLKRTNNPIWPDAMKELLITDRKTAKLGLVIKDDRDLGADPIIGTYQIKLGDMLDLTAKGQEWYNLAGVKTGRAKMMLQWKPLNLTGALGGSGGYVTPIGVMRFHFKRAHDLLNLEGFGKSDPYVCVRLSGVERGRTVTFQNNLNPDWDEIIYVPVHSEREKLTLDVMDYEKFQADRSLGSIELGASEFIFQDEQGEYMVNEAKKTTTGKLQLAHRGYRGTLEYTAAFYPALRVVDPEEEEEAEKRKTAGAPSTNGSTRDSLDLGRNQTPATPSLPATPTSGAQAGRNSRSGTISSLRPSLDGRASLDGPTDLAKALAKNEKEQSEIADLRKPELPKIRIGADDLSKYESGLLVFKLLEADLAHSNVYVEVVMDDMLFPSYVSSKSTSKHAVFNETGDAMIRELEMSQITLRLRQRMDKKADEGGEDSIIARLTGNTLDVLKRGLNQKTVLTLKDDHGHPSTVTVALRYLPIKMRLDPSESINNMGTLRVEVHDAANLPAADRNGFSDPYCKFILNDKQIHKTEVQKKTLHPSWNESFETKISSRTAAKFKVECWDWDLGDKDDHLGSAEINLNILEPFQRQEVVLGLDGKSGSIRLNMLFKPDYVTRARQGSTTFQGTFAVPGKVIGAPVKGVGKGAVFVGGNVVRGASFVSRGFRRKKTDGGDEVIDSVEGPDARASVDTTALGVTSSVPSTRINGEATPPRSSHGVAPSIYGADNMTGTATFTIASARGYEGSNVRVTVKQHTSKGLKEIHKSKELKAHDGEIIFDEHHETFKVNCAPDAQFSVSIKDVKTFGSDKDLGEGMLVVADGPGGGSKEVHAGSGIVTFRTAFTPAEAGSILTPERRSKFFGGMRNRQRSVTPGTDGRE